ncbi:unnamed protein product [Angiostrongylus costaricensis]|uniref:Uncharacterized protein n=1 Tax=Angiostrongylus costaricensis TaxID=334426 RepID=A0A3P7HVP4_ANGCS|nr:unnamed protein product [Angiostrongylus costaricensis]
MKNIFFFIISKLNGLHLYRRLLFNVKLICGIFLSLTIVSTVLACALWDFQRQPLLSNMLYMGMLKLTNNIAYVIYLHEEISCAFKYEVLFYFFIYVQARIHMEAQWAPPIRITGLYTVQYHA